LTSLYGQDGWILASLFGQDGWLDIGQVIFLRFIFLCFLDHRRRWIISFDFTTVNQGP